MIKKCEYLILGGGIAGLSVAIALKRNGINAVVAESAPVFKPLGAGLTLASNAIEACDRMGIADEIISQGVVVQKATILNMNGHILSSVSLKKAGTKYPQVGIHRGTLHRILLGQLDAEQVLWGKRSIRIVQRPDAVLVDFEDGESIACTYLIVAEGVNSTVRKQLLPKSKNRYAGYTCWRGVAEISEFPLEDAVEIWGKKGRFGYVGVAPDKVYWFATANAGEKDPRMADLKIKGLVERFKDYPAEVIRLLSATPDESVLWNDIVDLSPIPQYAFGNIVLVGDAAHATTPNMGQGACQAIEDAWFLSRCLQNDKNTEKGFLMFQNLRLSRTHDIVKKSWTLGKIAQWENLPACFVRDLLIRSVSEKQSLTQMEKVIRLPDYPEIS